MQNSCKKVVSSLFCSSLGYSAIGYSAIRRLAILGPLAPFRSPLPFSGFQRFNFSAFPKLALSSTPSPFPSTRYGCRICWHSALNSSGEAVLNSKRSKWHGITRRDRKSVVQGKSVDLGG